MLTREQLRKDFHAAGFKLIHQTINGHEVYQNNDKHIAILPPKEYHNSKYLEAKQRAGIE